MSDPDMKRASLAEIETMAEKGELFFDPNAAEETALDAEFWTKAMPVEPLPRHSVLLKLDGEVVEFFKRGGKGHLTRMQNVLKAYVNAHR